ncbi:hypothetical protein AB0M54_36880 [Actinoplanes sp. NPDC051470]|uniref:hypothetical protein n=1 Tax=Actinoplanes sp. NPDC051470 TaxID=3157224 RepID=UPI0034469037
MIRRRWRIRHVVVALAVAVGAVVAVPSAPAALADAAGRGGDYVPLTNMARVLNTLNGTGTTKGQRGPQSITPFQVLGVGGVPTTNVKAVFVNITTKAPTEVTFLTLFRSELATRPGVQHVNVAAGDNLSNSAIVEVGADGKLKLYNSVGKIDVIVDVLGYFTTITGAAGPGGFVPVPSTPTVLSTAAGIGVPSPGLVPAGGTISVNLLGGVVPAGSTAVFLDLQTNRATADGWIGARPTGGSGEHAVLAHENGTTAHGVMVRLAADGRADFRNGGTGEVALLARLLGYVTSVNTAGAGYRPLVKRVTDQTVAAGATVDLPIGGTFGLPVRNIAGVALNFTAQSNTENGYFKAYGLGAAEPNSSIANWNADRTRSALAVVKPGTDGKIRVKNNSTGSVRLILDLQGWFAEPITPLPIAQYAPTAVLQPPGSGTSLGTIEYAYVDNIGVTRLGHQTDPDNFLSLQWTAAPATADPHTGPPAIAAYADGRVQVIAQNTAGAYWTAGQTAKDGATFDPWTGIGGSLASPPTLVTLSTGPVGLGVDADGALWHYRVVTGTTSYWRKLVDQDLAGPVTAVPVAQGQQLFARDTSGAVRTALYATDGAMGAWTNLGGDVTGRPAVVVSPGSRLRVFVRAADGSVRTKGQDLAGGWASDWATIGTFTAAGAPAAILDPVLGRTALVVRGADNELYETWETAAGSAAWEDWKRLNPDASDPAASEPTIAPLQNGSGQTWVIVFRNINDAQRLYRRQEITSGALKGRAATPGFTGHTLPAPPVGR